MLRLLILTAALLSVPLDAQQDDAAKKAQTVDRAKLARVLEALFANRIQHGEQALCLAVVKDGEVLFAGARGKASKERTANDASLFPLGGMTRAISNLVVARLTAQKKLAPGSSANLHLGKRAIRDTKGKRVKHSLHAVMRGDAHLPQHRNFLPRKRLHEWPLSRALSEHLITMPHGATGSDLDYAVVQTVVESVTSKAWSDVVRELVFGPAGMKDAVADARFRLPKTAVTPQQKGLFGIPYKEPNYFSNFVAANGAWLNAADLGRLLLQLTDRQLSIAAAKADVRFAAFAERSGTDATDALQLDLGMPGMRGYLRVYPQRRIAWIVLSNYARQDDHIELQLFHDVLAKRLLPKTDPPDPVHQQFDISLGGSTWQIAEDMHGPWRAKFLLLGRPQTLTLFMRARGFTEVAIGKGPKNRITGSRGSKSSPNLRFNSPFPVRPELRMTAQIKLSQVETAADLVYEGPLSLSHRYCHMEWWLRVRQAR